MADSTEALAQAVGTEAGRELAEALAKIRHCVDQLSQEQVWWRSREDRNSIGNLILHLCGNIRQWIVAGIGGAPDTRRRPEEFAARETIDKARLIKGLESTVIEAHAALAKLSADELLRLRRIQGFEVTGLGAIFDSVPHFRGHAQEIVHMTRTILGDKYRFAWSPATTEQGAPG